eukprot:3029293-Prymnesium_polylepis.3
MLAQPHDLVVPAFESEHGMAIPARHQRLVRPSGAPVHKERIVGHPGLLRGIQSVAQARRADVRAPAAGGGRGQSAE